MSSSLPLQIVIDSSILRQDITFTKPDLLYIKELAKLKFLKIHFPWFVYKECTSNSIDLLTKEVDKSITSLNGLERIGLHKTDTVIAEKIAKDVIALKSKIEVSVVKLWNDFIKETGATLHDFEPTDSVDVFDAYFKGSPPFGSLKKRDDIPDAFIFQTIKKLSKSNKIHLIAGDKNLRNKCSLEKNVSTHQTFEEFFKSTAFKLVSDKHEEIKKFEEIKIKLIDRLDELREGIEHFFLNEFEPVDFDDRYLPSDNNEGIVAGIEEVVSVEIFSDEIKFIDGYFYIQVNVSADCLVEYAIFKSDYYTMDDDNKIHISELNDHYFEAEEALPITFEFNVKIPGEVLEEEDDFEIKVEEYDSIYVGKVDSVEVYSVDRVSIKLKAEEKTTFTLPKMLNLTGKTFKLEYPKYNNIEETRRIQFDVYNAQGVRVSKKIILESNGVTEFHMDFEGFMGEDFEFSFIDLISNCNTTVQLSIYRNTPVFPKDFDYNKGPKLNHKGEPIIGSCANTMNSIRNSTGVKIAERLLKLYEELEDYDDKGV